MIKGELSASQIISYSDLFLIGEHEIVESDSNVNIDSSVSEYYEFLTKGIHFIRIRQYSAQQLHFTVKSDEPYISLVFSFKSSGLFVSRTKGKVFADIKDNQSGLIFINNQVFDNSWITEPDAELYIINVTVSYFKRFLPDSHPLFDIFYSSIKENTPVLLSERGIEITPRMKALLYDMFLCEYSSHYKTLYLKSKFIELLMLQLSNYEAISKKACNVLLNDTNWVKMHEARNFIDANLAQPCTLLDLAQQVGTNECYLKKYFKQAFGTTVYGYLHKQRMERSKQMLLNGRTKIAEVAKLSGYKHASHFTTAFKKYFGFLPNQLKSLLFTFFIDLESFIGIEMMSFVSV